MFDSCMCSVNTMMNLHRCKHKITSAKAEIEDIEFERVSQDLTEQRSMSIVGQGRKDTH
jgi:hypothetical protein